MLWRYALLVELPLLEGKGVMPEVTFINGDDDCPINEELAKQSTYPQPLLIVERVSVLDVCLLKALVLELEGLLHHIPDDHGCWHLLLGHYTQKVRMNLIARRLVDADLVKVRGHCLNQSWVLALHYLFIELDASLSQGYDLFNHLLSEQLLIISLSLGFLR